MESMQEYREKKEGKTSPKTLIKNLNLHLQELDDVEQIVYVSKQKDGTVVCGHSSDYPTKHIGLLEIGKRILVDDMLTDERR